MSVKPRGSHLYFQRALQWVVIWTRVVFSSAIATSSCRFSITTARTSQSISTSGSDVRVISFLDRLRSMSCRSSTDFPRMASSCASVHRTCFITTLFDTCSLEVGTLDPRLLEPRLLRGEILDAGKMPWTMSKRKTMPALVSIVTSGYQKGMALGLVHSKHLNSNRILELRIHTRVISRRETGVLSVDVSFLLRHTVGYLYKL